LIEGISSTDYNVAQSTNVPLPNPDVDPGVQGADFFVRRQPGRNGGGNVNAYFAFRLQGFAWRRLRIFPQQCIKRQRVFSERRRRASPSRQAEYFWSQFGAARS